MQSQTRLTDLLDSNSDASQAKIDFDLQNQKLESIRQIIGDFEKDIAVLELKHGQAEQELNNAEDRIGKGLSDEEMTIGKATLVIAPSVAPQRLDVEERRLVEAVENKLAEQLSKLAEIEKTLVRLMELAQRVDTGTLADAGSGIEDIPAYLERLRVLNEEALPERRPIP